MINDDSTIIQQWLDENLTFYDAIAQKDEYEMNCVGKRYMIDAISKSTGMSPIRVENTLNKMTHLTWTYDKALRYKGVRGVFVGVRLEEANVVNDIEDELQ